MQKLLVQNKGGHLKGASQAWSMAETASLTTRFPCSLALLPLSVTTTSACGRLPGLWAHTLCVQPHTQRLSSHSQVTPAGAAGASVPLPAANLPRPAPSGTSAEDRQESSRIASDQENHSSLSRKPFCMLKLSPEQVRAQNDRIKPRVTSRASA